MKLMWLDDSIIKLNYFSTAGNKLSNMTVAQDSNEFMNLLFRFNGTKTTVYTYLIRGVFSIPKLWSLSLIKLVLHRNRASKCWQILQTTGFFPKKTPILINCA
jgi:hypothetical protein